VTPVTRRRTLTVVTFAAITIAWALPMQSVGCAQNAHYAGTRAIANGVPYIDEWAEQTCDLVRSGDHYFAAKGPALDFWSAPWYLLLEGVGAVPADRNVGRGYPEAMVGVELRSIWQINLWAVVLPAVVLLVLIRRLADEIEPGTGLAAAALLGLGTLVFPFTTLLFAHVPAATLLFGSFSLLFFRRSPLPAGVCAGLAVATDLPFALPATLVGLYAAARPPHLRRLAEYAVGGAVGLLPVWAFGVWAFGNPLHLGYSGTPGQGAAGGWDSAGFFGQTMPSLHDLVALLAGQRGLLVVTPVVALAAVGCVALWRRGLRAEVALIAAITVVELVWNSARHPTEFALGGWVPGPRFLIPLMPFLVVSLAPLVRRAPAVLAALGAVSVATMTAATAAEPLLSNDDTRHWLERIGDGNFTATVLSLAGIGHGWLAIAPFLAAVAVALVAAVAGTHYTVRRDDVAYAAAGLAAWALVERAAPQLLRVDALVRDHVGAAAAVCLIGAAAWSAARLRPEGLLLAPFAVHAFDRHTKWALLLGLAVLVALTTRSALPRYRASRA
jgi:hypothetical protein